MQKLFVINSNLYIRNYISSGVLDRINDGKLFLIANRRLVTPGSELEQKANFLGYFDYDSAVFEQNQFYSFVLMHYYRHRSRTFAWKLRIMEESFQQKWAPRKVRKTTLYQRILKLVSVFASENDAEAIALRLVTPLVKWRRMLSPRNMPLLLKILGRPGLKQLYAWWFHRNVAPNPELERYLKDVAPDLVMFPSNATDPVGNDLLRLEEKLGYRTLFLIDNWDNLSSKSVFFRNPDYVAVWGEQSMEHARDIHGMARAQIFIVGTPRFDHYYAEAQREPEKPYPFPYVLYVGCQIPFNELESLGLLDRALNEARAQGRVSDPIRIVYRPHPWRIPRGCPDEFQPEAFTNVILDEQLREHYYHYNYKTGKNVFQPSLDYYPKLLHNARLVIGPLTTMLLEAGLFRKPVVALAYDDDIHYTNPKNALANYRHFEGITDMPGIAFAHTREQMLERFLHQLTARPDAIDWARHERQLGYYLYRDETAYAERLQDVVRQIQQAIA